MKRITSLVFLAVLLSACLPTPIPPATVTSTASATYTPLPPTATITPTITLTVAPSATPLPVQVSFAVIGDYGTGNQAEADVAAQVHSWNSDLIITVGDNNYPSGAAVTIDANIGQFYGDYIYPYTGKYGQGSAVNRFFPSLGNHDWYSDKANPYLDYFSLPGNERYYDFTWGPVHFFALDSDENEPDGVNQSSVQAKWLQEALAASTSPWNVVYFHYPPYSSGMHGSTDWMRWPFAAWGASAVLTGHDHLYERLNVDGIPYFVDGAGGGGLYNFVNILPESQFRYNANYGAMRVTATETELVFEFINRVGSLIDSYQLTKP
jgi:tartrate-resistant acid phosphatase type 5